MPISSNATSAADKRAAKSLIKSLSKQVGRDVIDVSFADEAITVTAPGGVASMSREEFDAWASAGYPWNEGQGPELERSTRRPPKKRRRAKARTVEAAEPAPPPPSETSVAEEGAGGGDDPPPRPHAEASDEVLDALVHEAFEIGSEERSGEAGRNVARFRRGELMIRLRDISVATKTPVKGLLALLNERSLALASQHSVPDFKPISEQEATTTRKVVSAFGSSGEFRHTAGVDPVTGAPMVDDDGEPIRLPITEVAMNKLYPLADYVDEVDPDTLLSFAHANTEKVVKTAKRVSKRLERPISSVIDDVNRMRVRKMSPLGEAVGEIEVPPEEGDIVRSLRESMGEAPDPDIASLKTSRAWYEGSWKPIKALVDAVANEFIPDAVNESSGAVSNVFVLERLLTQYFDPSTDEGVQRVLGALVASEDLREADANAFVDGFAFDPDADRWVRVSSNLSDDDLAEYDDDEDDEDEDDTSTDSSERFVDGDEGEEDAWRDDDEDGIDFDDDDFEIDTPEGEEDDEDEGDGDEDF